MVNTSLLHSGVQLHLRVGTRAKTVKEEISDCNPRHKRWDKRQVVPFPQSQCWKSGIFSLFVEINSALIDWGKRGIHTWSTSFPNFSLLSGILEICTCYTTLSRDMPFISHSSLVYTSKYVLAIQRFLVIYHLYPTRHLYIPRLFLQYTMPQKMHWSAQSTPGINARQASARREGWVSYRQVYKGFLIGCIFYGMV